MSPSVLLRIAARIMPVAQRDRAVEEWGADLRGCAEVGLPPRAVTVGALRAAVDARRRALLALAVRAVVRGRVVLGILLGTACALADVPVLVVLGVAAALQVPLLLRARAVRRPSARRSRLRPVD